MVNGVSRAELQTRFRASGFVPTKTLGQNFLVDANIARKIADAAMAMGIPRVLEIGPGLGSLTVHLADRFERVIAVETDRRLAVSLGELLEERGVVNVELVVADALRVPLEVLVPGPEPFVVAASLPYNIASQIILRLLNEAWWVEGLVVMIQAELADRLLAAPGSRHSSSFGVQVALHASTRMVAKVPPNVFYPAPKVFSKVVMIARYPEPLSVLEPTVYRATIRALRLGFCHRRQMLRRNLESIGGDSTCVAAGIEGSRRAESLTIEEWVKLGRVVGEREAGN
ncbi:MAG: 16S rRNA (adenine(1518)-N(6)/adenine(1519)-N(6))-dimethyltransferase RsmA [Ferrimicrobium sp.]